MIMSWNIKDFINQPLHKIFNSIFSHNKVDTFETCAQHH